MNIKKLATKYFGILLCLSLFLFATTISAKDQTLGTMATTIIQSFKGLTKLITAGAYIAGLAFAIGSIMKFKQHKDNPTNIPIGTPIALVFIAGCLLFLPSVLQVTGGTLFEGGGVTAGPEGTIFRTK
jgi:intracellular multiplication protein IcmD